MGEKDLSNQMKDKLCADIENLGLPGYMIYEVKKMFELLNYFKISNLNSNSESFMQYLCDLNYHYISDVRSALNDHIGHDVSSLDFQTCDYAISDDLRSSLKYYLSDKSINSYLCCLLGENHYDIDLDVESKVKESLKLLDQSRVKIVTFLTLKISEFVHNPSRASSRVQDYFKKSGKLI